MKIYTKTGDQGETGLYGGERRSKADLKIQAYGAVDELQAALGVAMAGLTQKDLLEGLATIQHDCFVICAELARPVQADGPSLGETRIAEVESWIDRYQAELPELHSFIMQGGSQPGALLHLARAICRRAEREVVALNHKEPQRPTLLQYLNRLSDYLFTVARWVNHTVGYPERTLIP